MSMRPFGADALDNDTGRNFYHDQAHALLDEIREFAKSPSFNNGACYRALAALVMINALDARSNLEESLPSPDEVSNWREVFQSTILNEMDWLDDAEKATLGEAVDTEIGLLMESVKKWHKT